LELKFAIKIFLVINYKIKLQINRIFLLQKVYSWSKYFVK